MPTSPEDAMREEFEKWFLDYAKRQYPFYNDETISQMLHGSFGGTCWDAYRAGQASVGGRGL